MRALLVPALDRASNTGVGRNRAAEGVTKAARLPATWAQSMSNGVSPIDLAARALAAGDPLLALKLSALSEQPDALTLRAIALAQLGELERARELLRAAARGFGPRRPRARARCLAAQAE